MEKVVSKVARLRGSYAGQSRRSKLHPEEGVRKRCKKNSPSDLFCIDNRKRKRCDRGSEVGTVLNGRDGVGLFLRGNRRNLAAEEVVRKISFPRRVADVSNLSNGRSQWGGNIGKGECCTVAPVLASESASSLPGSPAWLGTRWKLIAIATRKDRESERSQISLKNFGWRNAGAVERRARADC